MQCQLRHSHWFTIIIMTSVLTFNLIRTAPQRIIMIDDCSDRINRNNIYRWAMSHGVSRVSCPHGLIDIHAICDLIDKSQKKIKKCILSSHDSKTKMLFYETNMKYADKMGYELHDVVDDNYPLYHGINMTYHWLRLKHLQSLDCEYILYIDHDVELWSEIDMSDFHDEGMIIGCSPDDCKWVNAGVFGIYKSNVDELIDKWSTKDLMIFFNEESRPAHHRYDQGVLNAIIPWLSFTVKRIPSGCVTRIPSLIFNHYFGPNKQSQADELRTIKVDCEFNDHCYIDDQ